MALTLSSAIAATSASWIVLAPHDAAHGVWRLFESGGNAAASLDGLLEHIAGRVDHSADIVVVSPLTRCIVMAVDLPLLHGVRLQQALSSVLGDRLISAGGAQHYAAAPIEDGRIREAAACDAVWLKQCVEAIAASGLRVVQIVPEACLLAKGAAWWGQLQTEQPPAWLMRAANGEAVRVAAPLIEAVAVSRDDPAHKNWQWFADPACEQPPALATAPYDSIPALGAAALMRRAATSTWDLRQFAFAAADRAARFMAWCVDIARQRSGRFALGALLAVVAVNVLGLNLYALKQQREIDARHAEMERIVTQALPGAPRLLEPALQLEAAWLRARGGASDSGAGLLLGIFAQTGDAQALTALDVAERSLRATYAAGPALERSWTACQNAALRVSLQRAGVRCTREGERLLLDFAREPVVAPPR